MVEGGARHKTWVWSQTMLVDSETMTHENPGLSTSFAVPPDLWLRINASLSYEAQGTDLTLNMVKPNGLSLCMRDPFWVMVVDERLMGRDLGEYQSCEARPNPASDWTTWALSVSAEHWDPRAPAEVPFEVRFTIEGQDGPWGNSTVNQSAPHAWAPIEDAVIRPGVKIHKESGGCTTNFVFEGATDASLYIGTAAHCLEGYAVGTILTLAGVSNAARLAYCSWGTLKTNDTSGCPFPPDSSLDDSLDNDFALLEIRPDLRPLVHPALRHWGGPTGLAGAPVVGTGVMMYGNSGLRDGFQDHIPDPADPIDGKVAHPGFNEWETYLQISGGIQGDSGAPVITHDGKALGVLRSLEECGEGVWQTITDLAPALNFLAEHNVLAVELATWPLLRAPNPAATAVHGVAPTSCP